jgi:hypothetical protein
MTAAEAMEGIDVRSIVHDLLKNGSRSVKLQTLTVLWDRIYGKPKQDVSVSGGLIHARTRDPFLASLPKEAVEALARFFSVMRGSLPRYWELLVRFALTNVNWTKQDSRCRTVAEHVCQAPVWRGIGHLV